MARLIIALVLSAVVTLGLFYLMQSLIKSADHEMKDPPAGRVLDFVRVKPEEVVKQKENKPKKPPKPKEPPPQMEAPQLDSPIPDASGSANTQFTAAVDTSMALDGGPSLESTDGDYLPIVRQPAVYPRMAQSRGIEGYVIVEFIVTKNGSVRDPMVVQAEPADLFNKNAVDAVLKYKYKPRVVNGEPTEVGGVQVKVTFEL